MSSQPCTSAAADQNNRTTGTSEDQPQRCRGDFCLCGRLPHPKGKHKLFTPNVLLYLAIILPLCIFVIAFLIAQPGQEMFGLGVAIAMSGWLFSSSIALHNRIKQHTFDLIRVTRFDRMFVDALHDINAYFRDEDLNEIDGTLAEKILQDPELRNLKKSLAVVLNVYELIAMAQYFNDTNKQITEEYFRDMFLFFYRRTHHYFDVIRKNDKDAYIYYECLVRSWS